MADHKEALRLATAAWIDLLGLTHAYQAAALRGDVEEAERLRQRAHDLLDANLDLNSQVAHAVKALAPDT